MHLVQLKSLTTFLGPVSIKYWAPRKGFICVAGFDDAARRVTIVYGAATSLSKGVNAAFEQPLIDLLAQSLEADITTAPESHLFKDGIIEEDNPVWGDLAGTRI